MDEKAKEEQPEAAVEEVEESEQASVEAEPPDERGAAPTEETKSRLYSKAEVAEKLINRLRLHAQARVDTATLLEAYDTAE